MHRKFRILAAILLACALGLAALPAAAQSISSITGIVKDTEGKPFPGATIVFKNTETAAEYTVKTDDKGHYNQVGMRAGVYDLTV